MDPQPGHDRPYSLPELRAALRKDMENFRNLLAPLDTLGRDGFDALAAKWGEERTKALAGHLATHIVLTITEERCAIAAQTAFEGEAGEPMRFKGMSADVVDAHINGAIAIDFATFAAMRSALANDRLLFRHFADAIALMCEFGFDVVAEKYGHKNTVEITRFLANHAFCSFALRKAEMKGGEKK